MRMSWAFLDRPALPRQLELVELLERLGYEAVYTVETRLVRDGVTPLGAFATRTKRIRLGLLSNSWTRDPFLMASTLAALDELAPGRVLVALSEYWDPLAANQGIVRASAETQIREYVHVLRLLLDGADGRFDGTVLHSDPGRLATPPSQTPPIHLLGTGAMMAQAAGETADGILLNGLVPPAGATILLDVTRRAHAQRSTAWDTFSRPQLVNVAMSDDRAVARTAARRLIAKYVAHQPHIAAASGLAANTIAKLRQIVGPWPGPPERVDGALHLIDDESLDRLIVAGTPADCRAGVRSWLDAGADEIVVVPLTDDLEGMAEVLAPTGADT